MGNSKKTKRNKSNSSESDFTRYVKEFLSLFTDKERKQTKVYDEIEAVNMNKKVKTAS